ncbi:MAG: YfjI family protein, partial [Phycisphaerales bacterium]
EWMKSGERWSLPICPFNSSHVGGSAYVGRLPSGAICAGCHHNSCSGWGWKELREHLAPSPSWKPHDSTQDDEVSRTPNPSVPSAFIPFPADLPPEPISSYIKDAAAAMSCDTALITLPILAGLACAIGTTHRIELKPGWTEPAIVWAVPVSESGTVKTPAQRAALMFLRQAQDSAFQAYELDRADFEARMSSYELELAQWKTKAKKGPTSTGEMPPKPAEPVPVRFCVSDVTIEALVPLLQANPRGLLLVRDEVSGWIASFDAYKSGGKGGGDAAHYLSLHSGESITVDRKSGTPPTIHVPLGALSIAGGIQPGVLAKHMSKDHRESGLLARMLLAQPPRRPKVWSEKSVAVELEARVRAVFGRLLALKHDREPFDPETECRAHIVTLTPEAKRAFVEFFNKHNKQQSELSGDLAAAWSKLEGYAARFALIIHLVRYAANDPAVPSPLTPVDETSMRNGIAMSQWFANETERVYAIMVESPGAKATRELVEWIAGRDGVVTANDLANGRREFKQNREGAELALVSLVERGLGDWEPVPPGSKGGRPTRRFRLRQVSADDTASPTNCPRSNQDPPASAETWGVG